jgi:hypothetical protein
LRGLSAFSDPPHLLPTEALSLQVSPSLANSVLRAFTSRTSLSTVSSRRRRLRSSWEGTGRRIRCAFLVFSNFEETLTPHYEQLIDPSAIASTLLHLSEQPKSCWTHGASFHPGDSLDFAYSSLTLRRARHPSLRRDVVRCSIRLRRPKSSLLSSFIFPSSRSFCCCPSFFPSFPFL